MPKEGEREVHGKCAGEKEEKKERDVVLFTCFLLSCNNFFYVQCRVNKVLGSDGTCPAVTRALWLGEWCIF